jgi:hypothetical protein
MGVTLTSKTINSTYDSLLKLSDNDQLTGAFKVITDGLGNDTGISINNTNQVNIAGQLVVNSSITANSFVRSGGLSSQFLKADGSVDSNTYQSVHQKGLANGYAPLDGGAKISEAYLPDSIVGQLEYQGTWNATTNTPTLPSASTVKGHYYVTSVAGTYQTIEYAIGDWVISNGTSWEKVDNTDAVTTVFGRIGAIVANSNDYSTFYHPLNGDLAANASTATTLQTARLINGTSFNGSANITTANWGTSRTITIGDTAKSLNGSTNVTWSRAELGITKVNIDALNIDADTLDGQQGSYYAAASSLSNYLPLTGGTLTGGLNVASGNVGIGTSSPTDRLEVIGSAKLTAAAPSLKFSETDRTNENWAFIASGGALSIRTANDAFDSYDIKMLINQSGNVGIGTTSPSAKFSVVQPTANTEYASMGSGGTASRHLKFSGFVANGTNNVGHRLSALNAIALNVNGTDALYIDRSGTIQTNVTKALGSATANLRIKTTFTGTNYSSGAYANIVFGDETIANSYLGDIQVVQGDPSVSTSSSMRFLTNSGGGNTATQERMRIDSAGNVGIGTTSPSQKLSVNGSIESLSDGLGEGGQVILRSAPSGTRRWNIDNYSTSNELRLFTEADSDSSAGAVKVLITEAGNVGIGTTSPTNGKLQINSTGFQISIETGTAGDGRLNIGHFSNGTFIGTYGDNGGAADLIRFGTNGGTERMRITSSGNVGIGTTSPVTKLDVSGGILASGNIATSSGNISAGSGQVIASGGNSTQWTSAYSFTNGFSIGNYYTPLDDRYFRRFQGTATGVSNAGFTTAFTVNGGNLASSIRFSVQGTAGGVVVSNLVDLIVNHYQDIIIKSLSGIYTKLTLKVVSNDNEDFAVELKTNDANPVSLYIEVLCYGAETVTFTNTHSYTGSTLEKELPHGEFISGTGGNQGNSVIDGNVGIGTSNPAQKLDVVGKMKISDDIILAQTNGRLDYDNGNSSGALRFHSTSGNTERMRITSAGNVGIGTTAPVVRLDYGAILNQAFHLYTSGVDYYGINMTQYDSGPYSTNIFSGNGGQIKFRTSTGTSTQSTRMTIDSAGNVGIGRSNNLRDILSLSKSDTTTTFGATTAAIDITNSYASAFNSYSGVNFRVGAGTYNESLATVQAHYTSYSGNVMGELVFGTRGASTTNVTERMRIDAGGNVGIGTSSPSQKLDVNGNVNIDGTLYSNRASLIRNETSSVPLQLVSTQVGVGNGSVGIEFGYDIYGYRKGAILFQSSDGAARGSLIFATNNSTSGDNATIADERMRIDSSGNVKINGSGRLQMRDDGSYIYEDNGLNIGNGGTGTGRSINFLTENTERMRIDSSGRVGIALEPYTSSGLLNLKGSGLALKNDLNGSNNNWSLIQNQATTDGASIDFISGQGLAMTIAHNRNVGIGTSSPSDKLHIYGGRIIVDNSAANQSAIQFNSAGVEKTVLYRPSGSNDFRIYKTGGGDVLSVTDGGNVGIGTITPVGKLNVALPADSDGNVGAWSSNQVVFTRGGTNTSQGLGFSVDDAANSATISSLTPAITWSDLFYRAYNHSFYGNGGILAMYLNSSGNVGIGTTTPNGKFTTVGTYATVTHSLAANDAISISSMGVNASNFNAFSIGQANSLNNSAVMRFKYNGANSTSNYAGFGFYGNDDILNIKADGNVGIGTTSPSATLHINGTGYYSNQLTVDGFGNNAGISFRDGFTPVNVGIRAKAITSGNRDGLELLGYNGIDFTINNGNTVAMHINGSGNTGNEGSVGIGTTSPSQKLQVEGTAQVNNLLVNFGAGNNKIGFTSSGNHTDGFPYARIVESWGVSFQPQDARWAPSVVGASFLVGFASGGASYGVGSIFASGDVTAYASDKRLKKNIKTIDNALEKVLKLNGVTYNWDLDLCHKWDFHPYEGTEAGVLAQEVQEVLPEVVKHAPFDYSADENGNKISKSGENYLTVDYEKMVPLLIEAIKEQQKQIDELKAILDGSTK